MPLPPTLYKRAFIKLNSWSSLPKVKINKKVFFRVFVFCKISRGRSLAENLYHQMTASFKKFHKQALLIYLVFVFSYFCRVCISHLKCIHISVRIFSYSLSTNNHSLKSHKYNFRVYSKPELRCSYCYIPR